MDAELAPAVVVRVAEWSVEEMSGFGQPDLAGLARAIHPSDKASEIYLQAYSAAIERESALLWERSAGNPRFLCALAIANPDLAAGLMVRTRPAIRNKRARHLETTLYRYLARAVGRTHPGGMWAAVTLARWGRERCVERRAHTRCAVSPDLAPFRQWVMQLASRSPYGERLPYKLNPTLTRQGDGSYLMWSAPSEKPSQQRRIAASPTVDAMLKALAAETAWSRAAGAQTIAACTGLAADQARQVIEKFCDRGVLVGGLAFPRSFTDAWHALQQVEQQLEPAHANEWRRARLRLAAIADELAPRIPSHDARAVLDAMHCAREELTRLGRALGIDGIELPRAALRCDVESPWRIELGVEDARIVRTALEAYNGYQETDGLDRPLLQSAIGRAIDSGAEAGLGAFLHGRLVNAEAGIVSWERLLADETPDSEVHTRRERRSSRLAQGGSEVVIPLTAGGAPPLMGAFHFSLPAEGLGGGVVIHGCSGDPTAAFARFCGSFDSPEWEEVSRWLSHCHQQLRESLGVEPIALLYDHPTPNVLAQPQLWSAVLDPWGVTPGAFPDRGLRLVSTGRRHELFVRSDADRLPAVVYAPTAANRRYDDPCVQALLLSSMHVPPLAFPDVLFAHESELERSGYRPRLRLSEGSVVQPRRTVLDPDDLQSLVKVKGAERFVVWQRLAGLHQWPELILVQCPGKPSLLVHRDSPLAVEAAFEGVRSNRTLIVEEFIRAAWVLDERNPEQAYLADIVVPVARKLAACARGAGTDPTVGRGRLDAVARGVQTCCR